jgi:hypothetical protein
MSMDPVKGAERDRIVITAALLFLPTILTDIMGLISYEEWECYTNNLSYEDKHLLVMLSYSILRDKDYMEIVGRYMMITGVVSSEDLND